MKKLLFVFLLFSYCSIINAQLAEWTASCQGETASSTQSYITSNAFDIINDCTRQCFGSGEGTLQGDEQFETIGDDQWFDFGINNIGTADVSISDLVYSIERSNTGYQTYTIELFINGSSEGIIQTETYTGTSEVSRNLVFSPVYELPSGQTASFRVRVSDYQGDVNIACNAGGNNGTFRFIDPIIFGMPLPIELSSFNVKKSNGDALLVWTTETEIDNARFEIEHSDNNLNFIKIGDIEGAGDSFNQIEYSFLHRNTIKGNNYYRLKQIDFNGSYSYSNTKSIFIERNNTNHLYPNRASQKITLVIAESGFDSNVEIFNLTGQSIFKKKFNPLETTIPIDISNLQPNLYLLKLSSNNNVDLFRFSKF